ncbi:MAG: hypothetical protein HRT69_08240 [Flavobacteriaceae bacterium]|nr:hypothetical protein [Flavobacteriaceae bacterium]
MKHILFISLIVILLASCNDDSGSLPLPIQNNVTSNFYALTVGNTWEYKYYQRNSNGNFIDTGVVDAVEITNTVNLNNNIYYEFKTITSGNDNPSSNYNHSLNETGEKTELLRDSLGYLINEVGSIKYTHSDYNERLTDTESFGTYHFMLVEDPVDVTTQAGSFYCLDAHTYVKDTNGNLLPSLDHTNYSDGFGLIFSTMSYVSYSEHFIEKRLNTYNIQ